MANKDLMQGALLIVEACAAAGALAAVNTAKANTSRGTYALMVKKDGMGLSTGEGGIDLDVALGAGLVLIAAVAPAGIAPHLAALGAGGLATYASRMGTKYGQKQAAAAAHAAGQNPTTVDGMPYGTLSGYAPRWGQPLGQVDAFTAGFANAQPAYAYNG